MICRFSVIPIKHQGVFFSETEKSILKFIQNFRRLQIAKTTLKENKTRGLTLSDFKTKLQAVKKAWYGHKDRHLEQWKRTDSPEINPHTYGQRILTKSVKTIQWRKDSLFSKWCWKN